MDSNTVPAPEIGPILKGQIAIVTGGSSGIGQAIAIALGKAGADVVVNYRRDADGAATSVKAIEAAGARAIPYQADVSQEAQVQAMFAHTVETWGAVDILINNAGLQVDAVTHEMTLAQWQRVIDVNLTGQFLCAREAIRLFKTQGFRPGVSRAKGKIVCISSVHERIPWAGHVNYAASKGGVMLMMQTMAQEYGPERIRINSICPGAIRTPINHDSWGTKEAYDALMTLVPMKRIGEPEDIGHTAAWLASDLADYITGASIFVDGGMTMYPGFEDNG
ncbi:MAG: SDR family oxidoreductase [Myxococcota bacterium]